MKSELKIKSIGFGGGCHWCTEAVFQQVKGVVNVQQGWIASEKPDDAYSEAVIIHYNTDLIPIHKLIRIHLHTHSSTSQHPMRSKYRSAIYYLDESDVVHIENSIAGISDEFSEKVITKVLPFFKFKENSKTYLNYYLKNPDKAFCKRYIAPKLEKVNNLVRNRVAE